MLGAERNCSGTPLTLVAGELGRSRGQTNRGNGLLAHCCFLVKGSGREQGREVCKVLVFDRRNNFRETLLPATVELDLTKQGSLGGKGGVEKNLSVWPAVSFQGKGEKYLSF